MLIVLSSLLFAALLSEGSVRVYAAVAYPRMMAVDSKLGWRHRPNQEKAFTNEDGQENLYRQNEFGHRPLPKALQSTDRTRRVLVLGDSFTEAIHVAEEEAFTALLAEADPSLNVLNAGVGAWGSVQQYLYLRDECAQFEPDLVLVVAYENDLTDNCTPYTPGIGARPWATVENDEVRIFEEYSDEAYLQFVAPVPARSLLIRHSYVFYAFNDRVWQQARSKELSQLEYEHWQSLKPAKTHRIFLDIIDRMHAVATDRGAKFALVLVPSHKTTQSGRDPWHTEVEQHAKASGFGFVSLLPALTSKLSGRCYFDVDIHWTPIGHRVAAEKILPLVQAELEDH